MTICNLDGVNPLDRNSWRTCEALPGVAYPGVWDNRSTINTKTGYDEYDDLHMLLHHYIPTHTLPSTIQLFLDVLPNCLVSWLLQS